MTEPAATPAERVRSVLVAAGSFDIVTPAGRTSLVGRHTVDERGHVHLPAGTADEAEVALELTDVAPIAVRHRLRAHVTLHGRLTGRVFRPACAQLIDDGYHFVDAATLEAARPDPLATREAALLLHLTSRHAEILDLMAALVPAPFLAGVQAVRPVRLDRFGVVLRLLRPSTERDVRLRFRTPLTQPDDAPTGLQDLLRQSPHRT